MTIFIPLLLFAVMLSSVPLRADDGLRILTYNIRTGLGAMNPALHPYRDRDRKIDLQPVIAAVRSVNADVVSLQEVRGEQQAAIIADSLGMDYVYAPHGVQYGKWWGLAILSRLPIADSKKLPVSFGKGNTRSDLMVRLALSEGTLTVIANHADKDILDGSNHKVTMANLSHMTGPLVLLGDFNARPTDKRLDIVRERFADAVDIASEGSEALGHHATYQHDGKLIAGKRIDYIFVDANRIFVRRVGLLAPEYWVASDHIGVFADLLLRP